MDGQWALARFDDWAKLLRCIGCGGHPELAEPLIRFAPLVTEIPILTIIPRLRIDSADFLRSHRANALTMKNTQTRMDRLFRDRNIAGLALLALALVWLSGCRQRDSITFMPDSLAGQAYFQTIDYPDLTETEQVGDGTELMSGPPMTISDFQELEPWELTLDECVQLALAGSEVMQKVGGVVVSSPQAATTLYDQAIRETNPLSSPEAALAAFEHGTESRREPEHWCHRTVRFDQNRWWIVQHGLVQTNRQRGAVHAAQQHRLHATRTRITVPAIP